MKTITISQETAKLMAESQSEILKNIAKENFPELFEKEKKWPEFGTVKGFYIKTDSGIAEANTTPMLDNRNINPTKKEAESALALSQLRQWRDKANGEPILDWCDWDKANQAKNCIVRSGNEIKFDLYYVVFHELAFKTSEIRAQFLKDHKTLLKTYFMID